MPPSSDSSSSFATSRCSGGRDPSPLAPRIDESEAGGSQADRWGGKNGISVLEYTLFEKGSFPLGKKKLYVVYLRILIIGDNTKLSTPSSSKTSHAVIQ